MTTGVMETKMMTPKASVVGFPPTATEEPMAKERMKVEAIGPELTLPLSNARPTNNVGILKDNRTAIA